MRVDANNDDEVIERMIQISSLPSLIRTFMFGKYKDKKIEDVAKTIQWTVTIPAPPFTRLETIS